MSAKKENDLHKSIIHRESSSAVTLAACLYGSILKGACWQPHLIKCCGSLTFTLRKIATDWHKSFFLCFFFQVGSRQRYWHSNLWPATVSRCHLCVRVMAPAGPLWLLGLDYIPAQSFRGVSGMCGGGASTSEGFTSPPSHSLFPFLQLSSKNICLLFLRHPPLTSVLASPWPILSIVVDVMTKNKQCEGVRLSFVWAGRSPSPLHRGRISPDEHSHFLLLITAPDRYANTNHCVCGGSDVK